MLAGPWPPHPMANISPNSSFLQGCGLVIDLHKSSHRLKGDFPQHHWCRAGHHRSTKLV